MPLANGNGIMAPAQMEWVAHILSMLHRGGYFPKCPSHFCPFPECPWPIGMGPWHLPRWSEVDGSHLIRAMQGVISRNAHLIFDHSPKCPPLAIGNGITTPAQMKWVAHISLRLHKGRNDPTTISSSARLLLPRVDREHFEIVPLRTTGPFLEWKKRKEEKFCRVVCFQSSFCMVTAIIYCFFLFSIFC